MITVSFAIEDAALRDEVKNVLEAESLQIDFEQSHVGDLDALTAATARANPDLILLDVSALAEPVREVIGRLRQSAPGTMIVVLNQDAPADRVLECFRAGAAEYLFPPLAEGLKTVIRRCESERSRFENGKPTGKLLVFLSAKGGCGATTLACHTASGLASLGRQVLLADLDMQNGTVAFLMKTTSPYSIADAVNNTHRLDLSYWKALVSHGIPGLEIISAPTSIAARQDMKLAEIRKVLGFAHRNYQWTLVDAGRGMTQATLTALEVADEACLIATPEVPALQQTRQILQRLLSSGYKPERLRLILNRVPKRPEIRPDEVQAMLGVRLYAAFPENYADLHDAYCQGRLALPETELGQHFLRLARKLNGVEEIRPPKRLAPLQAAFARMRTGES